MTRQLPKSSSLISGTKSNIIHQDDSGRKMLTEETQTKNIFIKLEFSLLHGHLDCPLGSIPNV